MTAVETKLYPPQKPIPKNRFKQKIAFIILMVISTFLLTGCVKGIVPLPEEERYQYIHQVQNDLDLGTAGQVREITYDDGDGVFTSSYLHARIFGTDAYPIIKERLNNLSGYTCEEMKNELFTKCYNGQIIIEIGRASDKAGVIYIKITDPFSGRDINEE